MKEQCQSIFSPEQFFELESACDQVEQGLKQGLLPDVEEIIAKATPGIRRVLRQEIGLMLDEHRRSSDTINPQSTTLIPETWDTKRRRSVRFESKPETDSENGGEESSVGLASETCFGRFQLHSIVGRGGSGTVWKAYDSNLDRWVALKISHPRSNHDAKRFVREAQAVAQLKHPGIIPVFEAGELDGKCYLVSEFCFGQPLSGLIKEKGPVGVSRAVEIALAIVDAIAHSHQMGIVHRDIKPHNVMISMDGKPMVTDFGLARNLELDQTLTLEGELIGTPAYMAPEQAMGGGVPCDERTDIYSIGVVLYQLLSNQLPFSGSFERVIFQVINTVPVGLDSIDDSIPTALSAICAKCLEKSPDRRFQSVGELRNELCRFVAGEPIATRKVGWVGKYARWLQREPGIAWLATGCALLLLMTTIGSTWSAYSLASAWRKEKVHLTETKSLLAEAVEARKEEGLARKSAEIAERLAKERALQTKLLARSSRQEADFLTTLLAPVDIIGVNRMHPGSAQGTHLLSAETIEAATDEVNRMVDAPRVQARVKGMLANAWRSLGRFDQAKLLLQESTRLLDQCSNYGEEQMLCDRAMNQLYWAYWHHHNDELVDAENYYRKSIELHQRSVNASEQSLTCMLQLAQAKFGLGALFLKQRMNEEAEPFLRSALEIRRAHLPDGDSLLMATELAYVQCNPETKEVDLTKLLATFDQDVVKQGMKLYWEMERLRKKKSYPEAVERYQQLIELISRSIGEDNALYVMAIGDFAALQRQAGNYREAFVLIKIAIGHGAELSRWHSARMGAMTVLGSEFILAHRFSEAKDLLQEVAMHRSERWNDSNRLHLDLAWCHFHLGDFEQAVERSKSPLESIGHCTAAETAWFCYTHATMLTATGEVTKAKEFQQQAIETVNKMVLESKFPNHSTWLKRSGIVLAHHGQTRQAEMLFRRAIEVAEVEYFADHPRVAGLKLILAENLLGQANRTAEAKRYLEESLVILENSLPEDDKRIEQAQRLLDQILEFNADMPDTASKNG